MSCRETNWKSALRDAKYKALFEKLEEKIEDLVNL